MGDNPVLHIILRHIITGLIYLSQSGVIRTILEMLPLADPFVQVSTVFCCDWFAFQPLPQKALLEVFFDIFQIRIPEWTECFIQVLKSVGKNYLWSVIVSFDKSLGKFHEVLEVT